MDARQALIEAIVTMREREALLATDRMLEQGVDPLEILEAYREALAEIGRQYEQGRYFLPELILSGEMLKTASEKIKPLLEGRRLEASSLGRVLIGTVEGDIHDLGKDIVVQMLDTSGFEVRDLGINVPARNFVEAARELAPDVIGLSGFLTLAFDAMKSTVEALARAGFAERAKIMIGGGQMDERVRDYVGADAYGKDAVEAVRLCRQWTGKKEIR
ncbi:MAG: cobalamin-dependent protein [bacterium]